MWNTDPDFPHRSCKISPYCYQIWRESQQLSERSLGAKYQFLDFPHFYGGGQFLRRRAISTEEADFYGAGQFLRRKADFYGGGLFLRRRAISTEEADFYGGGLFLRSREISAEQGNFYGGSWFLRRRLISTKEADVYGARQFVCSRLTLVWKIRTISQRKQVFIQDAVCFKVCSSGTTGPPYLFLLLYLPLHVQTSTTKWENNKTRVKDVGYSEEVTLGQNSQVATSNMDSGKGYLVTTEAGLITKICRCV